MNAAPAFFLALKPHQLLPDNLYKYVCGRFLGKQSDKIAVKFEWK